jgi:hypothetical protein
MIIPYFFLLCLLVAVDALSAAWAWPALARLAVGALEPRGAAADNRMSLSDDILIRYNVQASDHCNSQGSYNYADQRQPGPRRAACRWGSAPRLARVEGRMRPGSLPEAALSAFEGPGAKQVPLVGGFHATARSLTRVSLSWEEWGGGRPGPLGSPAAAPPPPPAGACLEEEDEGSDGSATEWIVEVRFIYDIPEDYFIEYSDIDVSAIYYQHHRIRYIT